MVDGNVVQEFIDAIKEPQTDTTKTYTAIVSRIDDEGVVWVRLSGGDKETPTALSSSEVNRNDVVNVEWRNNKLYIAGNTSNPSAGLFRVMSNEEATQEAWRQAESAHEAADKAWAWADSAHQAADTAWAWADDAHDAANEAETQAIYATNYANGALVQLSTVESVVDTLNWITTHSTFVPTSDTTVQSGKIYYYPTNNKLIIQDGTVERNGLTFVKAGGRVTVNGTATSTTSLQLGYPDVTQGETIWISGVTGGSASGGNTTYYMQYGPAATAVYITDGTVTTTAKASSQNYLSIYVWPNVTMNNVIFTPMVSDAGDGYEYEVVSSPSGNPSSKGYFELDTTEAVRDYVKAHLALTNDGLYVLKDNSGYKVLISNDGMYVQAPNGITVNQNTANGNVIKAGNGTVIANLGYGVSATTSGTASSPYYTFGVRKHVSEYSSTSSYAVGDLCYRTATGPGVSYTKLYKCITAIVGGETWNASHWYAIGNAEYGAYSVVEGEENIATGADSHVEGKGNIAKGDYVHIEGLNNADFARLQSYSTTSENNHIEGINNSISGFGCKNSHIEGDSCVIAEYGELQPSAAHVQGFHNRASASYQTVMGKYNEAYAGDYGTPEGTMALIVGNGTSDSARSNAMALKWTGDLRLKGNIYVGCNDDSTGGTPLNIINVGDINGTSQSAFETNLLTKLSAMGDGEIKMAVAYPNYSGSFTDGARSPAVLYRYSSGIYKCEILTPKAWEGYYYSSAWHWNSDINTLSTSKTITSGSANSLATTGDYWCNAASVSNLPTTSGSYRLRVEYYDGACNQYANPNGSSDIYFRTLANGSWSSWVKMPTRAEVNVLTKTVTGTTNAYGAINLGLPWATNEIVAISSSAASQYCLPIEIGTSTYAKVLNDASTFSIVANTSVTLTVRYREYTAST